MCGIFVYDARCAREKLSFEQIKSGFERIQYRGPDNSVLIEVNDGIYFGFHRLAIVGLSEAGDQPLFLGEDLALICNGEIYNYTELSEKYDFELSSTSDCEIILHLYKAFGIEEAVRQLDGVFAFALYDKKKGHLYIGRDPFGVRPLFIRELADGGIAYASELKALSDMSGTVGQFPPGCIARHGIDYHDNLLCAYHDIAESNISISLSEEQAITGVRHFLTQAVKKRLMSDREIGCLLSGGLDSSLIAALVQKYTPDRRIKTFSVGMKGSPDLKYARIVADHIGSEHHEVLLTEKDFLNAIPDVIYRIESYDITSVRASVGNYLISKYVREFTDCKVVFNGDGSDEVCVGYVYNANAPDTYELERECHRLVEDIHFFDVLRSDRSISSNGLEARTPFLDKAFVEYYLSIPYEYKTFDKTSRIEKHLLRKAFDGTGLLPDEVLWRNKCAFSDGVSQKSKSWHTIIKEYIASFEIKASFEYKWCPPISKESLYYREVFSSLFGNEAAYVIPYFWMPKWTDTVDPSARELGGYIE